LLNLAAIHEAISARHPERECLVFRDRRYRWRDVTDRTRRLAEVLRGHGLGCRVERAALAPHESGQDHVAQYLYNGNEYLEGMLGAFGARAVPVNVNYRYVDEELVYLLRDSRAKAMIYHACFAPTLARILPQLPELSLLLQVADESGEPLLPGARDYEAALAAAQPVPPRGLTEDDVYILYTGGTTGMPKGVLWRQADLFLAALSSRPAASLDEVVARADRTDLRWLPAPPFMHGAAHWAAFTAWSLGGTVIVQSQPRRLDPDDVWSTVERERVTALTIVGDAFGRPLVDQLARRRYDVGSLRLISSGGAILSAGLKQELLARLPGIRLLDALGSSESGSQGSQNIRAGARATTGDFEITPGNTVLREDLSGEVSKGSGETGWLARRGRVPLGYLGDPDKTARTFPVIGGVRYSVPGDRARLEADGRMRLLGRDSVTINTGGEKVFAEEVEHALKHHPAVYDAVVVGTPHERFGQQVTALVKLREGESPAVEPLLAVARGHLAPYKLPRRFVFVDEIVRSPSGKADYRWARARALEEDAAPVRT
jgi:fatty-acyl-CoA synthase